MIFPYHVSEIIQSNFHKTNSSENSGALFSLLFTVTLNFSEIFNISLKSNSQLQILPNTSGRNG